MQLAQDAQMWKGSKLVPLIIDTKFTGGSGLTNPSIMNDNGKLLVNIRYVNYSLYHCHSFFHKYGPLQYIHKEDDITLTTVNYLAELNSDLKITKYEKIDTSAFDEKPQFNFIGLEDGRLVRWDDKLYLIGVRRDDNPEGRGRMQMCEISEDGGPRRELSRTTIPTPNNINSFCEKNWMPIIETPGGFIKWTNPTEFAIFHGDDLTTSILRHQPNYKDLFYDLRGSSQVLKHGDNYIAIVHEAANFQSELHQKDAVYRHRLITWDNVWNITSVSKPFSFMGGKIEFCTGMCVYEDYLLISFGRQDSAAFVLKVPTEEFLTWTNN